MEKININEEQFKALAENNDVMVQGIHNTGMLYLLHCHGMGTIVSLCAFHWAVGDTKSKFVTAQSVIEQHNDKNIICTRCGSKNVMAETWINPNNNKFDHYSDESFQYTACHDCGEFTQLTDVNSMQSKIREAYKEYTEEVKEEPRFADCTVVYKDEPFNETDYKIKLSNDVIEGEDDLTAYYCDGLNDLLSLAGYGVNEFIIIRFNGFFKNISK